MPQPEYQIVTAVVIVTVVLLLAAAFIITLVTFNNSRKKKYIDEREKMKTAFQQEILRTQLEIQEQTLKNISQEIHDNIGQVLSLAKLNLATTDISNRDKLQIKIDDSKNLVAKAIQDLRDLSKSLNTDYVIQMGLARSIEYEMEMIRKTELFEVHFDIKGDVYRMEKQNELLLYRIVQETLNNILKHSKAANIYARLIYDTDVFKIEIEDDGEGFPPEPIKKTSHKAHGLGISNMRNRAALIHADLTINSVWGEGTKIQLSLPVISSLHA